MTELNAKNKEIYLDLCKKIWDFDDESLAYVEKRLSDDWEPVPEIKELINSPNATYEDQRIRFKMNMADSKIQSFFEQDDPSYKLFTSRFKSALSALNNKYGISVSYNDFITNKITFKKCPTKIKKVFEVVYAENNEAFQRDFGGWYDPKVCAEDIVKAFERIGASKKSAKQLEFVISLNPIDWLLASTSEEFSSCFNLANSGSGYQYCLGLPFLCGDKNRMMLYITNGKKKEFQGIKVDSVQTRTWCILDQNDTFNIVKWYPNDTIGYQPARLITGCNRFDSRDSFTRSKYNLDILSSKLGAYFGVYSDMGRLKAVDDKLYLCGNEKSGQQIFSKNLVDCKDLNSSFNNVSTKISELNVSFGFYIPKWIQGGFHFDKMFHTLRCNCCGEDKAGVAVDIVTGSIRYNYVCFDCYKKQFKQCKRCGRTYFSTESCKKVETLSGEIIELCERCAADAESRICSCCGKYDDVGGSLIKAENGKRICKSCATKEGYEKCDSCGTYSKNCKTKYNTFLKVKETKCDSCLKAEGNSSYSNGVIYRRYFPIVEVSNGRNETEI